LRRQIGLSGLAEIVWLGGALPEKEIAERLAAATVFALPSVLEKGGGMDNLPTVIAEAMAAGLPVVATPVAGIPEMVEQGKTGFLVAEHQPVALADAIQGLLGDISLAREFGKNGRARTRELFSIEQSAQELAELFASQEGPLP
jgi:glycosyltransferase involved in cell wall biosynthesis